MVGNVYIINMTIDINISNWQYSIYVLNFLPVIAGFFHCPGKNTFCHGKNPTLDQANRLRVRFISLFSEFAEPIIILFKIALVAQNFSCEHICIMRVRI